MQKRLNELHLERGRLIERIAHQRNTLTQQLAPLGRTLDLGRRVSAMADTGKAFVMAHPLAVGAGVTLVVALKPRAVLNWTLRGLSLWRTWRTVRGVLPPALLNRIF